MLFSPPQLGKCITKYTTRARGALDQSSTRLDNPVFSAWDGAPDAGQRDQIA